MNYPISSDTFANPLLVALLRELASCFNDAEKEFFVIGAAARDILRLYLEAEPSPRHTRDLDIAIAVCGLRAFTALLPEHRHPKEPAPPAACVLDTPCVLPAAHHRSNRQTPG